MCIHSTLVERLKILTDIEFLFRPKTFLDLKSSLDIEFWLDLISWQQVCLLSSTNVFNAL